MINWPVTQPSFTFEEITLRPLDENDIEAIFHGCQDSEIPAFTPIPTPYEYEMAEEYVRGSDLDYRNHKSINFAIIYRGEFAGAIGLHSMSIANHCAEIGYWLSAESRGKGICTQAVMVVTDFALNVMEFQRIQALADFDNLSSLRVLERAGYSREALLAKRVTKKDGSQKDMVLFAKVR